MFSLWREKTGSKTPREWSAIHRTPILCLIPKNLYDDAKKAFEVLNRTTATEKEIESALAFLEGADFYADLTEPEKVDQAFAKMLGRYKTILTDIEKVRDALERLSVEPYEWDTHPSIRSKILELAKAEYDAGGSDTVLGAEGALHLVQLQLGFLQIQLRLRLVVGKEGLALFHLIPGLHGHGGHPPALVLRDLCLALSADDSSEAIHPSHTAQAADHGYGFHRRLAFAAFSAARQAAQQQQRR